MVRSGVLPKQKLREMLELGYVNGVGLEYLNPASIDLPLSEEAYRLESIFLPPPGAAVRPLLKQVGATPHDLKHPLEVGVPYLIRVEGTWKLPERVYGYANPKSSSGRIFIMCRVVADRVAMYDALTGPGWAGEMWIMVRADFFPILVHPSLALMQARFFDGTSFLDPLELDFALKRTGLFFDKEKRRIEDLRRHADSLFLSIHVGEAMGWECRGSHRVLDLSRYDADSLDYFEPVHMRGGAFDLRKGRAYILSTSERVMVPPTLSAELRAIDPRFGEFRSHAAGYIDPGWGWGTDGSACGRPITLEVTPHEDLRLWPEQNIARIRYEHMKEPPETVYDAANSNYTTQEGPALAKFFKQIA